MKRTFLPYDLWSSCQSSHFEFNNVDYYQLNISDDDYNDYNKRINRKMLVLDSLWKIFPMFWTIISS
ncbi:MAG: hypothetical protein IPN93_09785 [Bacteroidetes bacterium]|nr:hypothetical protein [Bacteroidota bacterium]